MQLKICLCFRVYSHLTLRGIWCDRLAQKMGKKDVEAGPVTDSRYPLTAQELSELMRTRGEEAKQIIEQKYGSVLEICKKLNTSPNDG